MKKAIIYFSASEVSPKIRDAGIKTIKESGLYIVTVCLKAPLEFGDKNLYLPITEKSPFTQFKQILLGLENMPEGTDVVYFCEDDILYNPTHFEYTPPTNDAYYYNTNIWKLWLKEEIATHEDIYMPLCGLVADYKLMLGHYQRRVAKILQNQVDTLLLGDKVENEGYSKHMGYEPGGHMIPRGVDSYPMISWQSAKPIIDIRHNHNITKGKRRPEDYHDPIWAKGWKEAYEIPGWGSVKEVINDYLC